MKDEKSWIKCGEAGLIRGLGTKTMIYITFWLNVENVHY